MTDEERAVIVAVLCSQALADNLGDVRDAERDLWKLLEAPELDYDHLHYYSGDSAWRTTCARLKAAGIPLPEHLDEGDDDEDDG